MPSMFASVPISTKQIFQNVYISEVYRRIPADPHYRIHKQVLQNANIKVKSAWDDRTWFMSAATAKSEALRKN